MTSKGDSTKAQILSCAKEEFLQQGYRDASIRRIVERAGLTTGALYRHFDGKEALFAQLVEPATSAVLSSFQRESERYFELAEKIGPSITMSQWEQNFTGMLNIIYAHFDAFKLLIDKSAGSSYENFFDELIEEDAVQTLDYVALLHKDESIKDEFKLSDLIVLSHATYEIVFETIRKDMPRQEADRYLAFMFRFLAAGWNVILRV